MFLSVVLLAAKLHKISAPALRNWASARHEYQSLGAVLLFVPSPRSLSELEALVFRKL
jgi:hypothetical protein